MKPKHDDELYSAQLEWWICFAESQLGVRSNCAGFIATLERGGGSSGSLDFDSQVLERAAWGRSRAGGVCARARTVERIWNRLAPIHKTVIVAQYGPQRFPLAVEPRFGQLTGLVLFIASLDEALGRVLKACQKEPRGKLLETYGAAAERASRGAHRAFYAFRKLADAEELAA